MKSRFLALSIIASLGTTMALSSDANACGGCVVPPEDNTIVNSHRMALSISPKQTVLWDQIRYNGSPESWGWLLPVKSGAVIEVSTDAWFETLEAATKTSVNAPPSTAAAVRASDAARLFPPILRARPMRQAAVASPSFIAERLVRSKQ